MLVDIILACFNGERFIDEFLKSLDEQTHDNWRLIVRDDGSDDRTIEKIRKWSVGKNVFFVNDSLGRLNVVMNFSECLKYSQASYVLLADQDDVWCENKIEVLLKKIIEKENQYGSIPLVICSDLFIVDENLNVISNSFFDKLRVDVSKPPELENFLVQNVAPGCAMILNRELLNRSLPIPQTAIMHDWWFMLIAKTTGHIFLLDMPLIKYRQHSSNQVGISLKFKDIFSKIKKSKKIINGLKFQAAEVLSRPISERDREVILNFINILELNFLKKKYFLIRNKFLKNNFLKNFIFILIC